MGEEQAPARVLSGARPTSLLHLGNLVGALENWVALQEEGLAAYYFVADWHALTSHYADTGALTRHAVEMTADWLAAGLDPARSTLFVQSWVPEHAELHLLLSMVTPLGWLERVPTYKEQIEQLKERDLNTYGFLGYPVLQAADVVIYDARYVPVGEDQVAHLELTREIVRRFNHLYGQVLVEPQPRLTKVARLRGTDGRKMSKSYGNALYLDDDADVIERKVMPMVTDPARKRRTDPGDPARCPVFDLHQAFTPADRRDWAAEGCRTAGIGCVDCKKELLAHLQPRLAAHREKRRAHLRDRDTLLDILKDGSRRARRAAQATMARVRKAIRLDYTKP